MATNRKTDGMSSKTVSRIGIGILSGDLPQPIDESVGQTMTTFFDGSTPFPKASSEALNFLDSIDESDFRYLLFEDTLAIVTSESGKVVGEFQMMVSLGERTRHPVLTVKANSVGTIDSVPCGTSITGRLTTQMETLEQRIHEYVKLDGCVLDKVTEVIKRPDNYVTYRTVAKGEKQETTEYSADAKNMRGFVSEAANLLLQKLLLKKGVPENCQFITMDDDLSICQVVYRSLGQKMEKIGDSEVKVRGIERLVQTNRRDQPIIWHSFYNEECYLITRARLDGPLALNVLSSVGIDDQKEFDVAPSMNPADLLPSSSSFPAAASSLKRNRPLLTGGSLGIILPDLMHPSLVFAELDSPSYMVSCVQSPTRSSTIEDDVTATSLIPTVAPRPTLTVQPSARTFPISPNFLLTGVSSDDVQPDLTLPSSMVSVVAGTLFSVNGGEATIESTGVSSDDVQPDLTLPSSMVSVVAGTSFSVNGGEATIESNTSPGRVPEETGDLRSGSESGSLDSSTGGQNFRSPTSFAIANEFDEGRVPEETGDLRSGSDSSSLDSSTGGQNFRSPTSFAIANEFDEGFPLDDESLSFESPAHDSAGFNSEIDVEISLEQQYRYGVYAGLTDEEISNVLLSLPPVSSNLEICCSCTEFLFLNSERVRCHCDHYFHERCLRRLLNLFPRCPSCGYDFRQLL